jgi:hypothetical protein
MQKPINTGKLGMAIPRRISLLEESRNRGMAKYHSSGIEEGKIYSSGNRGISRNKNLNYYYFFKKYAYSLSSTKF